MQLRWERSAGGYQLKGLAVKQNGRWLPLPRDQRSRLGANRGSRLGVDIVAGNAVWDRQHRFRVRLGPMSRASYDDLLPPGTGHRQLLDWVRTYIGIELDWDVRLVLRASEVPRARLGRHSRLGWTSWAGKRPDDSDAQALTINPEHMRRMRRAAARTPAASDAGARAEAVAVAA